MTSEKSALEAGRRPGPAAWPDVESSTEDYARRFAGPTGAWFLKVQEEAVLRLLAPWPGATVLDVGGGHGQLAGPMAGRGYRVTVIGSDPVCVERIRPLVEAGRIAYQTGNLLHLPFPDLSFDVVTAFRLIAHVDEWRPFIKELARVARLGVIVDFASTRSLNILTPVLFKWKMKVEGNTRPYAIFKEAELLEEFRAGGFGRSERHAQFFFPMAAHRALGSRPLSAALEGPFRWTGLTGLFGSPVILKLVRPPRG